MGTLIRPPLVLETKVKTVTSIAIATDTLTLKFRRTKTVYLEIPITVRIAALEPSAELPLKAVESSFRKHSI